MEIKLIGNVHNTRMQGQKEATTRFIIDGRNINVTTKKYNSGVATTFTAFREENGIMISEWSDFGCFKAIKHECKRLTDKKLKELHEYIINNLEQNLVADKHNGYGIIAN